MATSRVTLTFDETILRDLIDLAAHTDRLPRIVAAASELPVGSGFSHIAKHVAEQLGLAREEVDRILGTLQNIYRTQLRMHLDGGQLIKAFTERIEEFSKEQENQEILQTWNAASGVILEAAKSIGADHPLNVARKAERLFFSHQHLLSEARVITDLRPVFDQAGEKVLRLMVTHTLLIDFYDGVTGRRLEIGLDQADLGDLRRACERAEVKAVALKDALKDEAWPTTVGLDESEA
ncbi:MAG: hypothetical protein HYS12_19480 [Planctomycetes bacterium]|nr:hypothetical protein [Planctomycetota bacterium]